MFRIKGGVPRASKSLSKLAARTDDVEQETRAESST